MPDYAIGDIQGCYTPLLKLLDKIAFNDRQDRLWLVGDLVNRGPQSLEVLRFVMNLPVPARITLGNHDLHLLHKIFIKQGGRNNKDDTLDAILQADDCEEIGHWLRKQSLLYHDSELNAVMVHAGIAPVWDLAQAKNCARELEAVLSGEQYKDFLANMYGNEPVCWSDGLTGYERLRLITNFFTRMRFCDAQGCFSAGFKGSLQQAPADLMPWYEVPERKALSEDIIFGHWAALMGQCPVPNIHAIDTGCLWGGKLTALRLQDKRRFSVDGLNHGLINVQD
ncbi:symmetrical bis(5'-nucleosyl)-tetraphosphatase [Legionella dresdenensis]|uniref:Bis(5'-nucleosyl)-tetraphosphatase, symmetrical n=1 Tax=Legionella dresdenensis TaxID=450200 RepID=A0ABV8CDF2_9GAMM